MQTVLKTRKVKNTEHTEHNRDPAAAATPSRGEKRQSKHFLARQPGESGDPISSSSCTCNVKCEHLKMRAVEIPCQMAVIAFKKLIFAFFETFFFYLISFLKTIW